MARLEVDGDALVVRLSGLERLGAFRLSEPSAQLSAIREVKTALDPWRELRGLRAPGTGFPGVIALGTRRGQGFRDFSAVYGRGPGVVVELDDTPWSRFVVTTRDGSPEDAVARIEAARR